MKFLFWVIGWLVELFIIKEEKFWKLELARRKVKYGFWFVDYSIIVKYLNRDISSYLIIWVRSLSESLKMKI